MDIGTLEYLIAEHVRLFNFQKKSVLRLLIRSCSLIYFWKNLHPVRLLNPVWLFFSPPPWTWELCNLYPTNQRRNLVKSPNISKKVFNQIFFAWTLRITMKKVKHDLWIISASWKSIRESSMQFPTMKDIRQV